MAVVDVIDLTVSPPPSVIVIDDEPADAVTSREEHSNEKKRKRERRERRSEGEEDRRYNGSWKHDEPLYEDWDRHVDEKNRKNRRRKEGRSKKRALPSKLFLVDIGGSFPSVKVDVTDSIPVEPAVKPPAVPPVEPPEGGLLLPAHVTVSAHESELLPIEDLRLSPSSDASGIDFLDDDRAVGAPRYFHDTATPAKSVRSRGPCTTCGDGDHDFKRCPNMICITCGARNEHSSGSCPILRHCWNCKAKGHLAKDCPRLGNMSLQQLNREDCERCGSWKHHGTNCPSLWRIYTYLTAADREAVLVDRESKRDLAFDNGGEGYIAHDHWCYNCGESGHLGDDCKEASHNHDQPNEYSAFGSFNKLSGPFASSSYVVPKFERPPREWEKGDRFDDGYGFSADNNVGKRGRENAKAKAREAHRIAEEGNDEIDWFDMNRAGSTKESAKAKHFSLPPKPPPPTVRFGARDSSSFSKPPLDSGNHARHPSQPSLRDRIDMDDRQPTEYSHRYRDRREMSRRDRRREESESRRRDRAYYSSRDDEPRRHHGSRWRGGYDR